MVIFSLFFIKIKIWKGDKFYEKCTLNIDRVDNPFVMSCHFYTNENNDMRSLLLFSWPRVALTGNWWRLYVGTLHYFPYFSSASFTAFFSPPVPPQPRANKQYTYARTCTHHTSGHRHIQSTHSTGKLHAQYIHLHTHNATVIPANDYRRVQQENIFTFSLIIHLTDLFVC